MAGGEPDNFFERILWYISVYPILFVVIISEWFSKLSSRIKKRLEPKHRELNWLRKLAGIPPK